MKLLYVQLALGLFQLDHAVKQEIEQLPEQEEEHLLPGGLAGIKRLHNYGIAGGHARGHMDKIIRWSGCVTAGIAAMFAWVLTKPDRKMEKTGYTFLLGGALSNLYDRCRKGYVTDYIHFHSPWKRLNELVFNLSDFFIMAGAVLVWLGREGHSRR